MTTDKADQDRLALLETLCRLAHVENEASAHAERRAYPLTDDRRRAERLAKVEAERSSLRQRRDELSRRVPDPEQVPAPDGRLPAERRRDNLDEYVLRRRKRLTPLQAKVEYLDALLADRAAPKGVRHHARIARPTAAIELGVLHAEPSDKEIVPEHMCADGVHLLASHGYVHHVSKPAWPCAAWPGQRRIFEKVTRILASSGRDHLTRWQLKLYCGHVVERSVHSFFATYAAAGRLTGRCEVCGVDPAFVVSERALGVDR